MSTNAPSNALIVLGMHRSGTSALTRVLNLLGAELGAELMQPEAGNNEAGFWEHARVVETDEAILAKLGLTWEDTAPLPPAWWKQASFAPEQERLRALFAQEFAGKPLWAVKDPRACRLLPLWQEALKGLNAAPCYILATRHPREVAASLTKRDGFPEPKGQLLWLQHTLEAEAATRGHTRIFITYDALMQDWRAVAHAIAGHFGFAWPNPPEQAGAEITAFLNPALRHHRQVPFLPDTAVTDWVKTLYEALLRAERKDDADVHALFDRLRHEVTEAAHYFAFWRGDAETTALNLRQTQQLLHQRNLRLHEVETALQAMIKDNTTLRLQYATAAGRAEALAGELNNVYRSTSWRVTLPLRYAKHLWRARRQILHPARILPNTLHVCKAWRKGGVRAVAALLKSLEAEGGDYALWVSKYGTPDMLEQKRLKGELAKLGQRPKFSVIMPVYNVKGEWLEAAIASVRAQIYENWELCIADDASPSPHIRQILEKHMGEDKRIKVHFREKNGHIAEASNSALALATGEFVTFLDHDDVLAPHALAYVARALGEHPQAAILYSDEDKLDDKGERCHHHFKPDWNPELLSCYNYFNHLTVIRRALVEKAGGFRAEFDGAQDYDLVLRCVAQVRGEQIIHIPHILYHWRAIEGSTAQAGDNKLYATGAARRALKEYFAATAPGVEVVEGRVPGTHRAIWPLPPEPPLVSIIIPTRNGLRLLRQCVSSVLDKTEYPGGYEIVIVDNQSDDPDTLSYFRSFEGSPHVRVVAYDAPFNFSALNNYAVHHCKGSVLCFLNNDIEIITPGWLREMVSFAVRPEVGAVGCKLYYPDGTVQHGGVLLGAGVPPLGVAGHLFHRRPADDWGYAFRAQSVQAMSAVTAACMVMRREVFEAVEGFDAEHLAVAFNDIDLCLRIRDKGYRNIFTPYAEAYHHESATRGYEDTPEKQRRFEREITTMRLRWGAALDHDPAYNPNLSLHYAQLFQPAFPPRTKEPQEKLAQAA